MAPAVVSPTELLDEAIAAGATPAAQACVIHDGRIVLDAARGRARVDSRFDVASVTKAIATTALAATLVSRGALSLGTRVDALLPERAGDLTIRELLAHGSGLPAWSPMFLAALRDPTARGAFPWATRADRRPAFARARELVIERTLGAPIGPRRGERVYSDLGFITLGLALEAAGGDRLDRLCAREVFAPLGMTASRFVDLAAGERLDGDVVPTGVTRPREPAPGQEALYSVPEQPEREDPGEVDDDNAWAMGGVAGHAGVFSTARDVAGFGWAVLEEIGGAGRLGAGEALARFVEPDATTAGARRGLGFDIPASEGSLAGRRIGAGPRGAFGHLGFTGCSLWVDRDLRLSVALLTNRVRPTRRNVVGLRILRPAFHDAVASAFAAPRVH